MKSRDALRVLAEVSESQWGMVTSSQANARGVSHMNLTRLAESGDLIRLSHGVYRDAGAPGGEHDDLRAAWLASEPMRLAWERLKEKPRNVIVSGESAAALHGIGNLRAMRHEFTTPARKQTQRPDVHYRTRTLTGDDVTVREGLPVTSPERTIADLVEQRAQLDHVGNALRDAARKSSLDIVRLAELLAPLAERNGHPKGDGASLLEELLEAARIDLKSVSQQILEMPDLGARVARDYLASLDDSRLLDSPAMRSMLEIQEQRYAKLAETLSEAVMPALPAFEKLAESMAAATAVFDSEAMRSILEAQAKQLAAMSKAIRQLAGPQAAELESIRNAIANLGKAGTARGGGSVAYLPSDAITTVESASLAEQAMQVEPHGIYEDES